MNADRPYVLSIAGFDPSGGAGVLADIKTFESNGVYGFGVVSGLTWQNDREFDRVAWMDVSTITRQVEVLLRRFSPRYVKIGLIESIDVLLALVDFLKDSLDNPVIVFDPILKASAGFVFHEPTDREKNAILQSGIYCITPNSTEATILLGEHAAVQAKFASTFLNIYLKSVYRDDEVVKDALFTKGPPERQAHIYTQKKLMNGEKHGSGCVFSSALTAHLALGKPIGEAAGAANEYTHRFLASNGSLLGYHVTP